MKKIEEFYFLLQTCLCIAFSIMNEKDPSEEDLKTTILPACKAISKETEEIDMAKIALFREIMSPDATRILDNPENRAFIALSYHLLENTENAKTIKDFVRVFSSEEPVEISLPGTFYTSIENENIQHIITKMMMQEFINSLTDAAENN